MSKIDSKNKKYYLKDINYILSYYNLIKLKHNLLYSGHQFYNQNGFELKNDDEGFWAVSFSQRQFNIQTVINLIRVYSIDSYINNFSEILEELRL